MRINDIIETATTASMITGHDIHLELSGGCARLKHNNYILYSSKNLNDLYIILKGIMIEYEINRLQHNE